MKAKNWNLPMKAIRRAIGAAGSYVSTIFDKLVEARVARPSPRPSAAASRPGIRQDWAALSVLVIALVFGAGASSASSDLVPRSITVTPSTVVPGGSITVRWRVANEGSSAANAYSVTVVRINQNSGSAAGNNLAQIATLPVAAGSSIQQSATLNVPSTPGTYYVWVIVDNYSVVTNQTNVSNDIQRSNAITVQQQVNHQLSVSVNGQGVVTSAIGINCSPIANDCSESVAAGTNVTLNAAPFAGWSFQGWSGACSGSGSSCSVSMTQARSVTATFVQQQVNHQLSVSVNGQGVVTSAIGINCSPIANDCSESVAAGTNVTLNAAPFAGWSFQGWSGACSGSGSSCTLSMTQARIVTATFVEEQVGPGQLIAPTHNATGQSTTPTLSWETANGANHYYLIVAESHALIQDIVSHNLGTCLENGQNRGCRISGTTSSTSHIPGQLLGSSASLELETGRTYYWSIQPFYQPPGESGCANCIDGAWAAIRSFSTVEAGSEDVWGSVTVQHGPGIDASTQWRQSTSNSWQNLGETIFLNTTGLPVDVEIDFNTENSINAYTRIDSMVRSRIITPSTRGIHSGDNEWSSTRPSIIFVDGVDGMITAICEVTTGAICKNRVVAYLSSHYTNNWGLSSEVGCLYCSSLQNVVYRQVIWGGALRSFQQRFDAIKSAEIHFLNVIRANRVNGRPTVIIAHSWGSVIAYQAITNLYSRGVIRENEISLFITTGSPLGVIRDDHLMDQTDNLMRYIRSGAYNYVNCEITNNTPCSANTAPLNPHSITRPAPVRHWVNYHINRPLLSQNVTYGDPISASISAADENINLYGVDRYNLHLSSCTNSIDTEDPDALRGLYLLEALEKCHLIYSQNASIAIDIRTRIIEILENQDRQNIAEASNNIENNGQDLSAPSNYVYPASLLRVVNDPSPTPNLRWSSACVLDSSFISGSGDRLVHGGFCPRYWITVAENPSWLPSQPGQRSCQNPNTNNGIGCDISLSVDHATDGGLPGSDAFFTVGSLPENYYGSHRRQLAAGRTYYWRVVAFEARGHGVDAEIIADGEYSEIGQFTIPVSAADADGPTSSADGDRTLTIIRRGAGRGNVTVSSPNGSQTCAADRQECVFAFPAGVNLSLSGEAQQSVLTGFGIDCGRNPDPNIPVASCAFTLNSNSVVSAHFRLTQLDAPRLEAPLQGQHEEQDEAILLWSHVEGADHYLICVSRSQNAVQNWSPGVNASWDSCRSSGGITADVIGMTYDRIHRVGDVHRMRSWQGRSPQSQPLFPFGTRYWRVFAVNEADQVISGSAVGQFNYAEPATHILTLGFSGTGSGRVTSVPEHFDCTPTGGPVCSAPVREDGVLGLSAQAETGSVFAGWQHGCLEVTDDNVCVVEMDQAKTVVSAFAGPDATIRTLSVAILGAGQGSIRLSPPNRVCVEDCMESYLDGTSVTISATPSSGSSAASWGGACAGTVPTESCVLNMVADHSVSYVFDSTPHTAVLDVSVTGAGAGSVSSTPTGIDCPTECEATFPLDTPVQLSASVSDSSRFGGWGGACSGETGLVCSISLANSQSVSARFDPQVISDNGFEASPQVSLATSAESNLTEPSVAARNSGGFAVGFVNWPVGTQNPDIEARIFNDAGEAQGPTFSVNVEQEGQQTEPAIVGHPGGVSAFWGHNREVEGLGWRFQIAGRHFDEVDAQASDEFIVTPDFVTLHYPAAASIAGGDIIVVGSDNTQIFGQRLDGSGAPVGDPFPVSDHVGAWQWYPDISALADGGFVVVWRDDSHRGDDVEGVAVRARMYGPDGEPREAVLLVNRNPFDNDNFSPTASIRPAVAGTPDGGFVVAWRDDSGVGDDADGTAVHAQRFDRIGSFIGEAIVVNTTTADDQRSPDVAVLSDGTFMIVWNDGSGIASASSLSDVRAQIYQPSGAPQGDEILVNESMYSHQSQPRIAALPNGGFVVIWTNSNQTHRRDIAGRVFSPVGSGGPPRRLALALDGEGRGEIRILPSLRTCREDCEQSFTDGARVTLAAYPDADSRRIGWGGACAGVPTSDSCTLDLNSDLAAAYEFAPDEAEQFELSVGFQGAGSGSVSLSPPGRTCTTTCSESYGAGVSVTLTASALQGGSFSGWGGACAGVALTCNVTMDQAHSVQAGFAPATRTLTVTRAGVGSGSVGSAPGGISCGESGQSCEAEFALGAEVTLTATPAAGSAFGGWSGEACADPQAAACPLVMNDDLAAEARFTLDNPPAGRIVAATLPGARSGYVGGGDITVFMTVLSRQSTPAQACRITAPNDPPFTLSYRQVNAQNEVIGDANPLFDLGNGGAINFVIALTPTRTTDQSGYVFLPRIQCENADLSPIEGVNSVLVSIGAAPVPDILSIGATPSGDGVVRIPETGNRISFLSAAAVNIGAGDGSAGAGEATVTASVDTGAASLPLTLEVCETPSTGGCITPRGVDNVTTVFESNVVKFFAVFVRANGEATVPFDPANARVFLRFADANGTIRSATSAAVSAPAAASDRPALQAAMPVGRWSVLVRQGDGEWPSLVRASLFVLGDGTAILDDGTDVTRMTFEGFVAEDDIGHFETRTSGGVWTGVGNIQAGPVLSDQPGDLWGVRDARSDMAPGWDALAGQYGEGVQIASDGSISGTFGGCIVSGQPITRSDGASGLRVATLNLMSCEASGEYRGVMGVPANDDVPALLLSGTSGGWRITRTQ